MPGVSVRVAFQGEPGAYSEEAVRRYWRCNAVDGRVEPVPARSCADVVRMVERGETDHGLLPIENSLAGSVPATYDALAGATAVWVVGETVLPIHHCLLGVRGATLAGVRIVESHPVALAQCGRFLERHPQMAPRAAYDTAGAAREVSAAGDPARAAIAGRGAAERFGLAVLAADIEDRPDNQTRFLALSRAPVVLAAGTPVKTALVATTPNTPGALHRLLSPLAELGINMSKLESRPTGEPWTYSFFLELEHEMAPHDLAGALDALRPVSTALRVLGTFTRAADADPGSAMPAAPARPAAVTPRDRSLRAIRGATTVAADDAGAVLTATRELLETMIARNAIAADDVVSAIFTTTPDLRSAYPATAARAIGWTDVPLLCMSEIAVPGGLAQCIRVLVHIDGARPAPRARHVYLRGATVLRPDLAGRDDERTA